MKFTLVRGAISLCTLDVKDFDYYLILGHRNASCILSICSAFFFRLAIISMPLDSRVGFSLTESLCLLMEVLLGSLNEYCRSDLL